MDDFERLYSLADGEDVKILKGPAIEARNEHFADKPGEIGMGRLDESGRLHAIFRWKDGKRRWTTTASTISSGGLDLRSALTHLLGIPRQEVEGDSDLFKKLVPGDFLIRDGIPLGQLVTQVEKALNRDAEIPVKLRLVKEMRDVVVASGRYRFEADPKRVIDPNWQGLDQIEVYAREVDGPRKYPRAVGGSDLNGLLSDLGQHFGARFVNEVEQGPKERLAWRISGFKEDRPIPIGDQKPTLQHLSDQTGLDFKVARREVRALVVERAD